MSTQATQNYRRTPKGVLTNIYSKQVERSIERSLPPPSYALEELHRKYLHDPKFLRLITEWEKSGYDKSKKPSLDRIDCRKGYSFGNINLMTWEDNRYKQRMERRGTICKPVYQIKNGTVVNVFKSQRHAVQILGIGQGLLSMALTGKVKTAKGYNWSYENPELLAPTDQSAATGQGGE